MIKRAGESVGGGEDAKKQRMGVDVDEQAAPFSEATKFRKFKLVVEGKTLFVNAHSLGEMSPFFETLCFGDFKEGREGEAELKEVKYDDVIEMLNVLGADYNQLSKEIDASNCVSMMSVANRWAIDILLKRCIKYIETTFSTTSSTILFTLELLLACEDELRVGKTAFRIVVSRLASFEPAVLLSHGVNRKISDPSLCGSVFWAARNFWSADAMGQAHVLVRTSTGLCVTGGGSSCTIDGCALRSRRKCRICEACLCASHAHDGLCDKRASGTVGGESSSALAPLDDRFFVEKTPE